MNNLARNEHPSTDSSHCRKEGFAHVARWISLDPDGEPFIFRKFNELAAQNLLYIQAEMLYLEQQLRCLDAKDANSEDMERKDTARTWETFTRQYGAGDVDASLRMALIKDLRSKTREYQESLILHSKVAQLPSPRKRVLEAYNHWFKNPHPPLGGRAKTFLDDPSDLVALSASSASDYLSLFLRRHWPVQKELSYGLCQIGRFQENSIFIATAIITIIVTTCLLIGPITGLYFVTKDSHKLAMSATFTALFALSIGLMTNARRAEIFGASAAYAAVLVVFVSGDISVSQPVTPT